MTKEYNYVTFALSIAFQRFLRLLHGWLLLTCNVILKPHLVIEGYTQEKVDTVWRCRNAITLHSTLSVFV